MKPEERKEYQRNYSRKYYEENKERWSEYRKKNRIRKMKMKWEEGGTGRYSVPRQTSSHGYYSRDSILAAYEQRREQRNARHPWSRPRLT